MLASVGIVKGTPFAPDERVRKVLEDAVVVGNATARTIAFAPREEEGFAVYPGSWWINGSGSAATEPRPPAAGRRGRRAEPQRRARKLNSRIWFLLSRHRRHPGDVHAPDRHRLQYLIAMRGGTRSSLTGPHYRSPCRPTSRRAASGR